ncbi:MAG TPA: fibronectin type III domain-containing protein, partial [Anaerolineae bacterium]|nr:fibronectin type III domain-containing protein [Anaerolineae bacterium]
PGPPTSLVVGPQGWSRENSFQVSWNNPLDFSGIVGALYRFDTPPTTPYNGTLVTTTRTITNMVVPSEGRHDLYLWLVDAAGNANPNRWVMAPDAIWYDGTPPTTTLVIDGTPGSGGWHTSDLEVTVAASETASGLAGISYQINGGGWISGTEFSLTGEGPYNVQHYGVDVAGNVEVTGTTWMGIDRLPPASSIVGMATYQTSSIFTVQWQGSDGSRGSGVTGYDLQVRQGSSGPWLTWLVNTPLTSALFAGQPGRTYYFRVRARDEAGHVEPYAAGDGDARTAVQIVANHDFEDQVFDPWTLYGALAGGSVVTETLSPVGKPTWVAQLGSPAYGPSTDLNSPGTVPVGRAAISQTVTVPGTGDMVAPALTLWYRIFSYDLLWSVRHQRFYDTFEVTIHSAGGSSLALVLRDGNDGGPDPKLGVEYGVLKDLGWRYATIDLTEYAGQTIQIAFANHNRWDQHFNTWTLLDDVQIVDRQAHVHRYLPLLSTSRAAQVAGAQAAAAPAGGAVAAPQQRPPGGSPAR